MFIPFLREAGAYSSGRWISADLHIHSVYSGGSLSPAEILNYASNHFFDAVAISDHNEVKGAWEGRSIAAAKAGSPTVLLAQEISAGDHLHFLLLNSRIPWNNVHRSDFAEKIYQHQHNGGITIWAHPWTMPRAGWALDCVKELTSANLLDALELFNSSIIDQPNNGSIIINLMENWVAPYNLGVVGGSDFHYLPKGRYIGSGRTYLKVVNPGEEGVLEALRARRTVAGIFSFHQIKVEGLGEGPSLLYGANPWYSELKQLVGALHQEISRKILGMELRKHLVRLLEAGHYQTVQDLLYLA